MTDAQNPPTPPPGLRFDASGLIPVIAQCADSGAVLMMAWMTPDTLAETLASGQMVYYSRSRNCRWRKGETSGNTQQCLALTADCDGDTILAKVRQKGAACHTGKPSCFFNNLPPPIAKP
ncbi:MAG: phosphoribosyl-AMP cyclohydrolase [Gammaproteobacteria bacterium]